MLTYSSCGETGIPSGARFCPACGTRLPEAAHSEEILKLVTVLFADVVGSTARAETLYPEDGRALMADFFAVMSQEIRAEGGTIEKFVGDAIMAVFGAPNTHEDLGAARQAQARFAIREGEPLRAAGGGPLRRQRRAGRGPRGPRGSPRPGPSR